MLSAQRYRALLIVQDLVKARPTAFAKRMWPDSPAWRRSYKCGASGATWGRGIVKSGGSFLGKLAHAGLVRWHSDRLFGPHGCKPYYDNYYAITAEGQAAISEYLAAHEEEAQRVW